MARLRMQRDRAGATIIFNNWNEYLNARLEYITLLMNNYNELLSETFFTLMGIDISFEIQNIMIYNGDDSKELLNNLSKLNDKIPLRKSDLFMFSKSPDNRNFYFVMPYRWFGDEHDSTD